MPHAHAPCHARTEHSNMCPKTGVCVYTQLCVHTHVLKVIINKLAPPVFVDSAHARRAIHSLDTAIRVCSVSQLTRKNPFGKISSWDKVMSLTGFFAGLYLFGLLRYGHILGITLRPYPGGPRRRPGTQAYGQEHRPSSSAPCAVPTGPSSIGHIAWQG